VESHSTSSTCNGPVYWASGRKASQIHDRSEWENVDFITTSQAANSQRPPHLPFGVTAADVALDMGDKPSTETETGHSPVRSGSESTILANRNDSTAPSFNTNFTSDTAVTVGTQPSSLATSSSGPISRQNGPTDQLTITRVAIQRQLRFLFIYPLIYLLLWVLPFVQHCLTYTDYYTAHPQFWLSICTTCILALQAGFDCVIFSWREKP
jgi:G protein-coupled glucose receptor regulating Gpa2 C-term